MIRRKKILVFASFVFMIFIPLLLIFSSNQDDNSARSTIRIPTNHAEVEKPTILLWTSYFGGRWSDNVPESANKTCGCHVTGDRSKLNQSSAVVFHLRDLNTRVVPKYHFRNQKFVLYNLESPHYSWGGKRIMDAMEDSIDWTMTYRSDSDVHVPYGYINPRPDGTSWASRENLFKDKDREIAWFVSNCQSSSFREDFVRQLAAYMQVDVYGKCGTMKCDDRKECYSMVEKKYKFYLSFENSLCKEYMTEKVFKILQRDIIPVVFGYSSDYYKVLPHHSFIDALSFKSPSELVTYLKLVSQNETLYLSYLNWKKNYVAESSSYVREFCNLCDKLKQEKTGDMNVSLNSYKRDLVKWWFRDSNCTYWKGS